jgi:hypothetical protein
MRRLFIIAPLLAACAAVPPPSAPISGDWGGTHVGLHLTPAGGTLEYDCAHGTIGPVVPSAGGRFIAEGTHTPEHGGPAREGETLPSRAIRYSGTVAGDRMTIEGLDESGMALGPYELRRGAQPTIFRCL